MGTITLSFLCYTLHVMFMSFLQAGFHIYCLSDNMEPLLNIDVRMDPNNYTDTALMILKTVKPEWDPKDIMFEVSFFQSFLNNYVVRYNLYSGWGGPI